MYNQKTYLIFPYIHGKKIIGEKPVFITPHFGCFFPQMLFKEVHTLRASAQGIESTTGSSGLSTTVAVKTSDSWTVKGNVKKKNVHNIYAPSPVINWSYSPILTEVYNMCYTPPFKRDFCWSHLCTIECWMLKKLHLEN